MAQPSLRFERGDLYAATGRFDALLARLLFQHLTRVPEALDAVASLLSPGGVAIIVDAHDAARHFDPAPPEILRFFRAYAANQATHGMSREAAIQLPDLVRVHRRLECARVTDVVIPSTVGENLELFKKTYYLVILMVEQTACLLGHDFERVKRAVAAVVRGRTRVLAGGPQDRPPGASATRGEPGPGLRTSRDRGRGGAGHPAPDAVAWERRGTRAIRAAGAAPPRSSERLI